MCTGLSLGTLLLSSVVELEVRVQHPYMAVLQYSLKGGVGPQGHMIQERQSLRWDFSGRWSHSLSIADPT